MGSELYKMFWTSDWCVNNYILCCLLYLVFPIIYRHSVWNKEFIKALLIPHTYLNFANFTTSSLQWNKKERIFGWIFKLQTTATRGYFRHKLKWFISRLDRWFKRKYYPSIKRIRTEQELYYKYSWHRYCSLSNNK